MKYRIIAVTFFAFVLAAACEDGPIRSSPQPVFPELPGHWKEIAGEPHWRIEWVGKDGRWKEREIPPGNGAPGLSFVEEWSTPILAWPFWPGGNLLPEMMRPAGAIIPWDISADKIVLSWKGGVDAFFWKELALAAGNVGSGAASGRLPWYFDWPRFRELLESGPVPAELSRDPWLADWKEIARKTVQSGFDRRRIVSRKFTELLVPGHGGVWAGSSPFAPPLVVSPETSLSVAVSEVPDVWVSENGILKCSLSGWVFIRVEGFNTPLSRR